jgi:hypothetical protein
MSVVRFTSAMAAIVTVALLVQVHSPSSHAQPARTPARPNEDKTPASDERIKSLIATLSDEDFRQRIKAQNELISIGGPAEPQLLERLKQNPDAETRTLIESILKSIAQARHYGPTLVTLQLNEASTQQAFAALAEQSRVSLAPGAETLLDTKQRIDVDFNRTPMWEALLKLCAQSGVAFNSIDSDGRIVLELLPSNGNVAAPPAATAGQFLVTIHHIETNVSKSVAFAGKRPLNARQNQFNNPPCRLFFFAWGEPRLKPIRWFIDSVDECVTDTGHDMRNPTALAPFRRATSGGVNDPNETMFTLAAPDEKAKRIARLAITARFALEKRMQKLEIPNPVGIKDATHRIGDGFRLVIKDVNKVTDGRYAYNLAIYRDNRSQADWDLMQSLLNRYRCRLLDAQGNELQMTGGGGGSGPNELTQNNTVTTDGRNGVATGEPAKLVWEFPEEVEQVIVRLVFRDVPLP